MGLFSPEAAEKLKQLFSTLLAPAPRGRDSLSAAGPAIVRLHPESGTAGTPVTITGRNLSEATAVIFGQAMTPAMVVSDEQVTALVPAGATTGQVRLLAGDQIVNAPREFSVPKANLAPTLEQGQGT
ncbi:MAG TPA: IPT/TIG domain-containing protein [Streptosporangiaceae bacterium]|nr:IPT/TIG domain-containing protein [Streptosporangiaceae bacterium]